MSAPVLCTVCGNTRLPGYVTPKCLMCQGLAQDWDFGREATGIGLGQMTAEANAAMAELSGTKVTPGPIPISARVLKPEERLDRYNPKDCAEIREHWNRARLAGLNRVPVGRWAATLVGVGLILAFALPSGVNWLGGTIMLIGVTFWLAPWWWLH